jgi:hypothetical protein
MVEIPPCSRLWRRTVPSDDVKAQVIVAIEPDSWVSGSVTRTIGIGTIADCDLERILLEGPKQLMTRGAEGQHLGNAE